MLDAQVWSSPNLAAHMTRAFSSSVDNARMNGGSLDSHALVDAFDRHSDMDRAMSMDAYGMGPPGKLPAMSARSPPPLLASC